MSRPSDSKAEWVLMVARKGVTWQVVSLLRSKGLLAILPRLVTYVSASILDSLSACDLPRPNNKLLPI